MRPALRRAALLLPLLAAGCGGPLLSAELEIPEVGLEVPQQTFPASSADPSFWCAADRPDCVATELSYDLGSQVELIDRKGVDYELRLTSLALVLGTVGAGDLHGVRSVQIVATPPSGGAPVTVASYVRSASDPTPATIAVSGNAAVDLRPFIQAGIIDLRLEMAFDAPTPEFTADVDAVFYLKLRLDYLAAAGL